MHDLTEDQLEQMTRINKIIKTGEPAKIINRYMGMMQFNRNPHTQTGETFNMNNPTIGGTRSIRVLRKRTRKNRMKGGTGAPNQNTPNQNTSNQNTPNQNTMTYLLVSIALLIAVFTVKFEDASDWIEWFITHPKVFWELIIRDNLEELSRIDKSNSIALYAIGVTYTDLISPASQALYTKGTSISMDPLLVNGIWTFIQNFIKLIGYLDSLIKTKELDPSANDSSTKKKIEDLQEKISQNIDKLKVLTTEQSSMNIFIIPEGSQLLTKNKICEP